MVCNTSFTDLSDSRVKTEIAEADVAELLQLFDSVEAKQDKRPDMNEDLRLGFASDDFEEQMEEFDGDHAVEPARDGHPRLRNMADTHRRTIKAVYKDPRTGFGSIAQTLQRPT